jgi:hypothetical protein
MLAAFGFSCMPTKSCAREGKDGKTWTSLPRPSSTHCNEESSDCSTDLDDTPTELSDASFSSYTPKLDSRTYAETLIIFDWDDTLFPTAWVRDNDLLGDDAMLNTLQITQLSRLTKRVRTTLDVAAQIGRVVIVTNAQEGWVEMMCKRFMPSLANSLKSIDVVSARSVYSEETDDAGEWKHLAFSYEVALFQSEVSAKYYNLVSIGDSLHELHALLSVAEETESCWGKSLKLVENPSIEKLIEQHTLLEASMKTIVNGEGDVDVQMVVNTDKALSLAPRTAIRSL